MAPLNRIMIFGLPGSGKSTFAVKLAHKLKLPLHHLDKHYFVENWRERNKEEFFDVQQGIVEQNKWIIDGNAIGSLAMRYSRADLVLYFATSRPICFSRLIKRQFFKDRTIQDRAPGCRERLPYHLVKYMWTFDRRVSPLLSRLKEDYPDVLFYKIKSSHDLEGVLNLFAALNKPQ